VPQASSVESTQEQGKLRLWTAKALTFLRLFYQGFTWERLKSIINALASSAAKLLWITVCILIFGLVVRDLSTDLITIEPISVPKAFSESGYTPEVASRRLNDALNFYAKNAGSIMQGPSVAARDDLPKFVVPKIDLSLDTIIASIRGLLHYGNRQSISGELTVRGKLAWLRLRVDGKEVHSSPSGFDLENPDELFVAAVPALMDKIRPYLVASTIYNNDGDSVKGLEKVDEIITRLPASDINVQWSYMLKGHILTQQKDLVQAEKVLRKAVSLNETNSIAHLYLGYALQEQGKLNEAISEYHRAIAENRRGIEDDPRYAELHNRLGIIFQIRGKFDDAVREYRRAIEIDPRNAASHYNLALALNDHGDADEAIAEYRRSIAINPKDPDPYNNLAAILRGQGKLDDAIIEYRHAIDADPNNEKAKNDLGSALKEKRSKSK
jgi:tetratricopeptide (TPR) repeat protein